MITKMQRIHNIRKMIITQIQKVQNLQLSDFFNFSKYKYGPYSPLYPALNDTFVFICLQIQQESFDREKQYNAYLIHLDSQGKILLHYRLIKPQKWNYKIDQYLLMVSEDQVIVAQWQQNKLTTIDLATQQIFYFQHKFVAHCQQDINIYIFSETNVLGIFETVEENRYSKIYSIKLTYYNLPLSQETKSIACCEYNSYNSQYFIMATKGNNHSMIIWLNSIAEDKLSMNIFDLRDSTNGKMEKIEFQLQDDKNQALPYSLVRNVWEKRRGQFLLAFQFEVQPYSYRNKIMHLRSQDHSLRETSINLNYQQVDQWSMWCYNLGQFCFIEVSFYSQQMKKVSLCLHNQTEQIIIIDRKIQNKDIQTHYYFSIYNPRLIYSKQYSQNRSRQGLISKKLISSSVTNLFNCYQVILHFLIKYNEDFDDDLLKDVVEQIDYCHTQQIKDGSRQYDKQSQLEQSDSQQQLSQLDDKDEEEAINWTY